jgi:hypothetical protein
MSADPKAKRIALSMKALEPGRAQAVRPKQAPPEPKKASLDQQLAKLSEKFRAR